MVTRSIEPCQSAPWQRELARAYTTPEALLESLGLTAEEVPDLDRGRHPFGLLVPRGFAALMRPGDAADPLLLQVLPLGAECSRVAGYSADPVGDVAALRVPGLLQKYDGRALLLASGACAIHCRYCFRRHFPGSGVGTFSARTEGAIAAIARDPDIHEVILSGGDPLMLDDSAFTDLLTRLDRVPHLQRLRIHTRLPIVLPARVTPELCSRLAALRTTVSIVIHANHPDELGPEVQRALKQLRAAPVVLLNQSVLLRRVNDRVETLCRLSERLFDCGVLPYYLHQLDPVNGAAHFEVSDSTALSIMEAMRATLPGYLVPRLVRDSPGAAYKHSIDPAPEVRPNVGSRVGR